MFDGWVAGIVQPLLDAGAVVDARAEDKSTPLMAAVSNGHGEIIDLLAAAGADINAETQNGLTALKLTAPRVPPGSWVPWRPLPSCVDEFIHTPSRL